MVVGNALSAPSGGRGYLSFISLVSVLGLAVGVAVLIVVLSVMNGFGRELQGRILSVTSHATLMGLGGDLSDWQPLRTRAQAWPGVTATAPYIEQQALLMRGARSTGTMIRGVDPQARAPGGGSGPASAVGAHRGSAPRRLPHHPGGCARLRRSAAGVGDSVVLIAPQGSITPAGLQPRMRRFRVVGIFHSGMYEYDRGLALLNLQDAARIYQMGSRITGIRLALADAFQAPQLVRALAVGLGGGFSISDWTRVHSNFFRSIEMTKSMLFLILLLLVAVAAFNIVAALVMVVKEKRADMAILRTLGAGPRNILAIFAIQGTLIGLIGTLSGALLGTLLARHLEVLVHGLERLLGNAFSGCQGVLHERFAGLRGMG